MTMRQSTDRETMEFCIDAMIAGAEKAGTTSLVYYLASHPKIVSPVESEIWTQAAEFPGFVSDAYPDRDSLQQLCARAFSRQSGPDEITLAKSVDILHLPEAARRLHAHNPACRLIVSLRNPVDRAYSSFWYQRYRGAESCETFEEAIELERQRSVQGVADPHRMYLGKGRYVEHLKRLVGLFGETNLFVVVFEELRADPRAVLAGVLHYLGLEDHQLGVEELERRNPRRVPRWPLIAQVMYGNGKAKRIAKAILPGTIRQAIVHGLRRFGSIEGQGPPMNAETRADLLDYFQPFNRQLREFLGRDLESWQT